MAIHTFAAIDVGSYELELKIFEITRARGIRQIDSIIRSIPLGEDTYKNGKISSHHVQEVARILKEFSLVMKNYRVQDYKAYGTSAIREMENASIVLSQWEQQTGIHIDVLSNSEQRFLDYKSVASRGADFEKFISDSCAIIDIGGGSIQISLFNEGRLITSQNLKLGVLILNTRVNDVDARTSQKQRMIQEMVNSQLEVFRTMYLGKKEVRNIIIVDDYLSAVSQSQNIEYIDIAAYDEFMVGVKTQSTQELMKKYHISADILELLSVSAILIECITENFGTSKIWLPGVTLCDGIAYEYAEGRKILPPSHDFEADIIASAQTMAKRYQSNMKRGQTIQTISMKIFDATKKLHGMDQRERMLLQLAATLHDCGKYISMVNLAECSYNIIMSTEIIGISHKEREILANVVRFNHEDFVYYEQQECISDLNADTYLVIAKLTAILRVANGLDRSHKQKFGDLRVAIKDNKLILSLHSGVDITLEKGLFSHRADFFEEVMGIRPVIKQRKQ